MRTKVSFAFTRLAAIAGLFALVGVSPARAAAHPAAIDYGNNPAAGRTFIFNGNRFYYECYGRGLPVLLIHGNGVSISSGDPKPLQLQLQFLDLLGNQPHIPVADLKNIEIPTLVMAADRDVIRDEHTLSMFHAIP